MPVLPACIVVAPGDYSPEEYPAYTANSSLLVRLQRDVASGPGSATGTIHNEVVKNIDEEAIRSCTGDFALGFEVSFGTRGEVPDLTALFYKSSEHQHIAPREMRVKYKEKTADSGAVLGQLTSGLCSPWQTDFTACTGYWTESLPVQAFLDEDDQVSVNLYRKSYDDVGPFPGDTLQNGDDFERHQDKIGVARIINNKRIETERSSGDDIIDNGS